MNSGCYYKFSPFVHHVLLDGEFVLLDEIKDRYLILNRMQSESLISFMSERQDPSQCNALLKDGLLIASCIPQVFKSSGPDKIGMDNLVWGSMNKNKYILNESKRRTYKYATELLCAKLRLWRYGLHGTFQKLRKLKRECLERNAGRKFEQEIMEIPYYMYKVSLWFPVKIKCLELSLALSFLLLKAGFPCVFKLGVQKYDFLSHAWVELDDNVLGDNPALKTQMPVILEI